MAFSCQLFSQSSVLDVRLVSAYASVVKINKVKGFHRSNIALPICYLKQMGLFFFLSVDFLLEFFCYTIGCFITEYMIHIVPLTFPSYIKNKP